MTQASTVPYRQLGHSPLKVSTLCLGTMMFGDQTELREAADIVASAAGGPACQKWKA